MRPELLTLDELLSLHAEQIRLCGGASCTRDLGLMQSAVGSVEATFGGVFLHDSIFAMAAAYLYGICRNPPFLDGNKRKALGAALTFLEMNGVAIDADEDSFYDLIIGVAERRVSKPAVTVFLDGHL